MADQLAATPMFWYTDGSRYAAGFFCPRYRYLTYHAAPTGYGFAPVAKRWPLVTGGMLASGVEAICKIVVETDTLPTDAEIHTAVETQVAAYRAVVDARGFGYFEADIETMVEEQIALIRGLLWAWALYRLPKIHAHEKLRWAEVEDGLIIGGCTCGLPPEIGLPELHAARGCAGVFLQTKADLITESRMAPGTFYYREFKSTGYTAGKWQDQWETTVQLATASLGIEQRHGITIAANYVEGLYKGKRQGDYNPETKKYDGPKRQQSPLVWAYHQPAQPPLAPEEWAAKYEWIDAEGAKRRLPKTFKKAPTWEYPEGGTVGWVKALVASGQEQVLRDLLLEVGPLNPQQVVRERSLRSWAAEELRWQEKCWALYDVLMGEAGGEWSHPAFQAALDLHVPQSFKCREFGKDHQCVQKAQCFMEEGWEDPIGRQGMAPRVPHHEPEKQQAIARGLIAADGVDEEQALEGAEGE